MNSNSPFSAGGAVDLHAHWTPPAVAQALRQRDAIPRITGGHGAEMYHSIYGSRPFLPLETDLAARVAFMDAAGVQTQVLSLPGLFGIDCLPVAQSMPLLAVFNDEAARARRAWPGRFEALAALPHPDMALACKELRRALGLGLRGAILPADGFTSLEAAERFRPLIALASEAGCHLFIHPGPVSPPPPPVPSTPAALADARWLRHIVLATQARLSEVMVTLNLTDFLAPYPGVTVQVANLGGALPFYLERIDQVGRAQLGEQRPTAPRMRRCYVDTSSFGPRAIEMAVRCFGADRVVFGTDCPIFETPAMLRSVMDAAIGEDARALILHGNARRLLGHTNNQETHHEHLEATLFPS
jgi:predicted TIM-barrel fold metal-dependent hydrolase